MKLLIKLFAFAGLGLTLAPSIFYFKGIISLDSNKMLMGFGAALWLASFLLKLYSKR